jgi:hypothetical protein
MVLNPGTIVWTCFILHVANDKLERKNIYFNPEAGSCFLRWAE